MFTTEDGLFIKWYPWFVWFLKIHDYHVYHGRWIIYKMVSVVRVVFLLWKEPVGIAVWAIFAIFALY